MIGSIVLNYKTPHGHRLAKADALKVVRHQKSQEITVGVNVFWFIISGMNFEVPGNATLQTHYQTLLWLVRPWQVDSVDLDILNNMKATIFY